MAACTTPWGAVKAVAAGPGGRSMHACLPHGPRCRGSERGPPPASPGHWCPAAWAASSVFFSSLSPLAGTLASLGTFAAGYVARPLGGVIFGHVGDRFGRKRALMVTLVVMALASVGIGLIPSFERIGI